MTTRRQFLSASLAAGAVGAASIVATPARAQGLTIGTVQIAFAPTVQTAWGEQTGLVAAEIQHTLATILGPSLQRGTSNRLVINITSLWLGAYAGGGGGGKPTDGGGSGDFLESTVSVYDRAGTQLASWPIRSTESSSSGGAWYRPDVDQRRLQALACNNAGWIKRYLEG